MGKIFCLMGKSSSGKDTIFKLLKADKDLSLKPIIPYTTRPKRENEGHGTDYFFIDQGVLEAYNRQGKIIEQREYQTVNGKWYYATVNDGQIDLARANYLLIGTLSVYNSLQVYFGSNCVVPLYIDVDDATRLERAMNREKQQQQPNYNEMCRRFLADSSDFSTERLLQNSITKWYNNNNLTECINKIKTDILTEIN
ncbi:Guanylate kinase [bioreactor metagenome]|uniref:Guanylate kinase n=1 Tax=bioreactor metagenome TaxID=1076179 RepID=A0A644TPV4_9ZZZZ|nr:guanylate kinase [Negativicutes bacterium]